MPYFRRLLRFMALPYCYFFLVNWKECTSSRFRVASDLLYIFFRLKYFPDNYSPCRLWAVERESWPLYYGSMYDPYQRRELQKEVTPPEYRILFTDKEVSQRLCEGLGLPVPRMYTIVNPGDDPERVIQASARAATEPEFVLKPVRGIGGRDIYLVRVGPAGFEALPGKGAPIPLSELHVNERMMLQARVIQDPALSVMYPGAINTLRVQTLLTRDGDVLLIGGAARFGRGATRIDNVSTGGIGVGIDTETGTLLATGKDFGGREYQRHPETNVAFAGFEIPRWAETVDLVSRAQRQFSYFKLLGFDIAISTEGPIIIEINSLPDNVGLEGSGGPILANPKVLKEFDRYGLLINEPSRALARRLRAGDRVAGGGE